MSGLYWRKEVTQVRTFSAQTRAGGRSVVKVEFVTTDEYDLSDLLRQLKGAMQEQEQASKPLRKRRAAKALERPQELLRLTYRGD